MGFFEKEKFRLLKLFFFDNNLSKSQLHRIGQDLNLGADIMDALPFSSAPPPSVFLPSTSADDINIPFFAVVVSFFVVRVCPSVTVIPVPVSSSSVVRS